MIHRTLALVFVYLTVSVAGLAQASRDARFEILQKVIAEQAASRIAMPFGNEGVELSDSGEINQKKLAEQIKDNGRSIEEGKVVNVTAITFDDKSIEIELDGGGKNKRSWLDRIQGGIGMGGTTVPVQTNPNLDEAKGSKVVLKFSEKIPANITAEQLKQLLDPVLDFNKSNFLRTGVEALPPEFKEAVLAKEARIGMDRSTVLLALGRPDDRFEDKPEGVLTETWLYYGRGYRATFVKFQDDVVMSIIRH